MMRKSKIIIILDTLFSLFMVIGFSFKEYGKLNINNKTILLYIVCILLFWCLLKPIFDILEDIKIKQSHSKKLLIDYFLKHIFPISMIVIISGWVIYIIAYYPTILSNDPSYQILQFFGIDNKYSYYRILLDKDTIITNHHPVFHTLLLGSFSKFGIILGDINRGLFMYSLMQIIILSATLSYTLYFMKTQNLNIIYILLCLIIYTIVPVFPMYAMSPVKDVIYSCLIVLYIIFLYNIIRKVKYLNNVRIIKLMILIILIILFRNNGFYVILLSLPLLLFIKCIDSKKIIMVFMGTIISFFLYNSLFLPYFKITPSSMREVLSIPLQQTARYVLEYGDEVTLEEKRIIDRVLGYETLKQRYNPEKADPVKNEFNYMATSKDIKNYFIIWFKQFCKHPKVYFEATLNNIYGYFYPFDVKWYLYYKYSPILKKYGFNYKYNNLNSLRDELFKIGNQFRYVPILGLFVNIGFNTWMILFMGAYLIYKKKYKYLICFAPSFITLLVCVASPVNTYFRYALPNIFALPTLIAIFVRTISLEKKETCSF